MEPFLMQPSHKKCQSTAFQQFKNSKNTGTIWYKFFGLPHMGTQFTGDPLEKQTSTMGHGSFDVKRSMCVIINWAQLHFTMETFRCMFSR